MESGAGEGGSSSAAEAAGAAEEEERTPSPPPQEAVPLSSQPQPQQLSRYELQKRRDWNAFLQYLKNHKPPLTLERCSGAHVIEFLKHLDQFGKTKVHAEGCPYFGDPHPPAPCACPLKQAWGSLDALIGRLRAAYEESGGKPESNPFAARAVRIYLREVRESQAKARGIPYEKKKRKRSAHQAEASSSAATVGEASSKTAAELSSPPASQPSPSTSSAVGEASSKAATEPTSPPAAQPSPSTSSAAATVAATSSGPSSSVKQEEPPPAAAPASEASVSASAAEKRSSSKSRSAPAPGPSSSHEK